MVRKDPLNVRGPAPPGGRPPYQGVEKRIKTPQSLLHLLPAEEYEKLWRHGLVGTSSCVGLLEGYSDIGMPMVPVKQIRELAERLLRIVEKEEKA